jgi:hypothetical protein
MRCLVLIAFSLSLLPTAYAQVVTTPDQVSINTPDPQAGVPLHITDNAEAIRLDGTGPYLTFYDGITYNGYLWYTNDRMYLVNQQSGDIRLGTNSISRVTIDESGDVGMGTVSPESPLHVSDGNLFGATPNSNSISIFEKSNGNGYLSILTPSDDQKGILFGDGSDPVNGGIIYNPSGNDRMAFRTNGNITRMVIDNQGDVGIGEFSPLRPIHVKSRNGGDEYGIMIERSGSSVDWEMSVFQGRFNWFYDGATTPTAFITTDGTYSSSDRRLKTGIDMSYHEVMPHIRELPIGTYQLKVQPAEDDHRSLGLIAQDVVEAFPEIVRYSPNREGKQYYSIDYSKTGVIALKGLQEMDEELTSVKKENEELAAENRDLRERLAQLEQMVQRLEGIVLPEGEEEPGTFNGEEESTSNGQLLQNQPNPFDEVSTIRYRLPERAQGAELRIVNQQGQLVRRFRLDSNGKEGQIQLQAGTLAAGTYSYSLFVNGQRLDTKQLILQ